MKKRLIVLVSLADFFIFILYSQEGGGGVIHRIADTGPREVSVPYFRLDSDFLSLMNLLLVRTNQVKETIAKRLSQVAYATTRSACTQRHVPAIYRSRIAIRTTLTSDRQECEPNLHVQAYQKIKKSKQQNKVGVTIEFNILVD